MKIQSWARENRPEAAIKAFSLVAAVALLALSSYALASNPSLMAHKWVEGAVIGGSALIALAIVGHTLHKVNKRADTPTELPRPTSQQPRTTPENPQPTQNQPVTVAPRSPQPAPAAPMTPQPQPAPAIPSQPTQSPARTLEEKKAALSETAAAQCKEIRTAMRQARQANQMEEHKRLKNMLYSDKMNFADEAKGILKDLATDDRVAPDPLAAVLISREGVNIVWDYALTKPSQSSGKFKGEITHDKPGFTYYPLAMSTGGRSQGHACAILVDHRSKILYYYDPFGSRSSYTHIPSANNGQGQSLDSLLKEIAAKHNVQSIVKTNYKDQKGVGCTIFCICWVLDMARGQQHEQGLSDRARRDRVAHEICDFGLGLFNSGSAS